ncbi:MAG TPA: caspase family protein [Steroidobacteraceae bacterium]
MNSWGERRDLCRRRFRRVAAHAGFAAVAAALISTASLAADGPDVFAQLGHSNVVHSVAFSANGRLLASGGEDGAALVWDVATRREFRMLKLDSGVVDAVSLSPDGALLAAGTHDGTVVIWEIATGRALHVLKGHSGAVNSVAFTSNGRMIASGSADHTVKLWDAAAGTELKTLSSHRDAVTSVAFSSDDRMLASGSVDKTVKLWEVASGHEIKTLSGHTDRVSSVAFCPAPSSVLASGSWDHAVKLWDASTGREVRTLTGHTSQVWSVACAKAGRVASGGYDHSVRLWDAATGQSLRTLAADAGWVESVSFSPDGRELASGGADHSVKLWSVASGEKLQTLEGHADFVKSLAFSANGRMLVSGGADRAVRLWLVADGHVLRQIPAHDNWVGSVAFSPDNHAVASRSGDRTVKLWDIVTGRVLHTFSVGNAQSGSASIAISPDGHSLAAGIADNSIKLWRLPDGAELKTLAGHAASVEAVAFSADGRNLASGDARGSIRIWDVASGREQHTLSGHTSWVGSVAFSPDGRTLASGGGDKTLRLWDVQGGKEQHVLRGHEAAVTSLSFDPKNPRLASSDESGIIKLWDLTGSRELRTLAGHSDLVESVAFSPDGMLLASASADSTIRLWDVASGEERVRLIAFRGGSVLRITPQGYYDFQGDGAEEYLNVRAHGEVSGIEAYREKFYRPDLVRLALNGRPMPAALPTIATVKPPPDVVIVDAPAQTDAKEIDLQVRITDRGGGIGTVRTLVNGSAVSQVPGGPAAGSVQSRSIHVKLEPHGNDIRVVAFNTDGSVQSNAAEATVAANFDPSGKPQLHALVVGIQEFDVAGKNLEFSVADATAIAQVLEKKAAPLFSKVNVQTLTTKATTTKAALMSAFERYRSIDPQDVFVFYAATHGSVEGDLANPEYYLITSNVKDTTPEAIRRDTLSGTELRQLVASIPATRKLLLLDTCQSGAAGDAMMLTTRGLEENGAVTVLSGAVGSTVLSASTREQSALEGQDGHGLFTWVLLHGLQGDADARHNGYIKTFDLAAYVDDEVPKISQHKQNPNLHNAGQSFEIVSTQ